MVVPPLIFCALASGAMNIGGGADARRVVTKSLVLFLSTAALAVALGAACGAIMRPGEGVADPNKVVLEAAPVAGEQATAAPKTDVSSLKEKASQFSLKPMNPVKAMAEEHYIQIIYFAFLTGLVINYIRNSAQTKRQELEAKIATLDVAIVSEDNALEYVRSVDHGLRQKVISLNSYERDTLQEAMTSGTKALKYAQDRLRETRKDADDAISLYDKAAGAAKVITDFTPVVFKMIELIVQLAPLAVFGAMSNAVGSQGVKAILDLKWLLIAFMVAVVLQYILFGALIALLGRLAPLPFYQKIFPIQSLAFATSSSKATLRPAMKHLHEELGVSERHANFVLPLGASINMDGTAIYLALATTFFAQMMDVHLGMHEYAMLILSCTVGSIGAAGIPSGSLVFMGVVTSAVGIPLAPIHIGMITAVDSILDRFRTALNITGDCALTLIISSSENEVDEKVYYS
jgi:Na+/H+-dicarboxylate symporter